MDRPAEGLFVNDINEKDGEEKTTEETEDVAKKTDHPCFDQDRFMNLPSGGTHGPEDPDVPLPVDDQGVQGIDDPEDGDDDSDEFEGIGDGKRLIKDF